MDNISFTIGKIHNFEILYIILYTVDMNKDMNIHRVYIIPENKIPDKEGLTIYENSSTGDLYEAFRIKDIKKYNEILNYITTRLKNCGLLKMNLQYKLYINEACEERIMKTKKGNDAISQVQATVSKILNETTKGKELILEDVNIEQRLAYHICRDLGLICGYVDETGDYDWIKGCNRPPRARGLCMKHFQKIYHKYVYDD